MTLAVRSRGFEMLDAVAQAVATRTGVPPDRVREIARFCDILVAARPEAPVTLTLCRGMSCSLHGAERVHGMIAELVAEEGLSVTFREVFCLGQCDYGPSLMVDGSIYLVRDRRVVEDRRHWRQGDSGPVPIGDASAPVLD
jgi:NADH:ubiquinone oxidoreductase subunit E